MENRASSARMRRSQASANWNPAPIACPCTAATLTRSGRRSHAKPSWNPATRASASVGSSPANSDTMAPAAVRSSPAENARPSPRSTTTRMSPGNSRPMSRSASQVAGVWALSASGRHNVIVATGPARSHRTPATVGVVTVGGSRLLAPARTAALTQLDARLGQYPVDESVRAAGRGSQGPDALSGRIPLDQVLRERLPLGSDDPATLFGGGGAGGCHVDSSRPY